MHQENFNKLNTQNFKKETERIPLEDQDEVYAELALARKNAEKSKKNIEGHLTLDVYEKPDIFIIKSTIAGVQPKDIDINITKDSVSIRGHREEEEKVENKNYLYRENYWGTFSRSVVLPSEIDPDTAKATLKNGVLTIVLPKIKQSNERQLKVEEI